jgi:uncharacterized protein (TIGR00369 family)
MKDRDPEVSSEFLRVAGLRFEEIGGDRVLGSIQLDERHHTPWGVVHGGVYTAAVESAASVGASAAVEEKGQFAVGLNNSTDFLRPTEEGQGRGGRRAYHARQEPAALAGDHHPSRRRQGGRPRPGEAPERPAAFLKRRAERYILSARLGIRC